MIPPLRPGNAWQVDFLSANDSLTPLEAARDEDARWYPLQQAWRDHPEPGFQPSHARVRWRPDALYYDIVLFGAGQQNRAQRMNELTWDLGDVYEVFLCDVATGFYIELHITPENQRLQLRFPFGAIDRVRRGKASLEDYMIHDAEWARTATENSEDIFAATAVIPARSFAQNETLSPASQLRTAVCRYDYRGRPPTPILSSTALLPAPSFHAPHAWSALILHPEVHTAPSVP